MKEEQVEKMRDLSNWTDTKDGRYIFRVYPEAWYEISILYHARQTDIVTAKAELYCAMEYATDNGTVFERRMVGTELPVFYLLETASKDFLQYGL